MSIDHHIEYLFTDVPSDEGNWRDQAACKGMDTDMFFPDQAQPVPAAVKKACKECTVRQECLDYAVSVPILMGYFGGMNVRQRRIYRREWLRGQGIVNVCAANNSRLATLDMEEDTNE